MPRPKNPSRAYLAMLADTEKRRQRAKALALAGKKPREIAEILGVTRQRAEQMIKEAGA